MVCPAMNNALQHLRLADYVEKPWKNRRACTLDLPPAALLPL
jgi:hypothetical protein